MRALLGVLAAFLLAACASIGRPKGGPIDEEPPVFVGSKPAPQSLNIDRGRLAIEFNENVQVKDAMTKVTVSPAQITPPRITAVGRRINVELRDTLIPNTTYTIDFGDAISDLNESNEIDGFSIAFSTGPDIDTLCISGMVFKASNLEPAQGMIVGVYSNLSDTAIRTLPLERITKTNQYGQFTLRNLKPGEYRIYALDDKNRDYKWDRTEDVAFYDVTVSPTSEPTTVADTLLTEAGTDSIVMRPVTRFLPDDILLTWFNENYKSQYLVKYERADAHLIKFEFGAPADTLPEITILNGPRAGEDISRWTRLNGSATLDTLEYWITDSAVIAMDSITVAARFMRTDTLDRLSWGTDTLQLNIKNIKQRRREAEKKQKEEEERLKKAREINPDTVFTVEPVFASLSFTSPTTQDLNKGLAIKSAVPIARFDTSMVSIEQLVDTIWTRQTPPTFRFADSLHPMAMTAEYVWEPGTKYRIVIDSLAMTDIYGHSNKTLKHEITTRKIEDYGVIHLSLKNVSRPAVAQLLNTQDNPVATVPVVNSQATFRYIQPGTYYARLWLDTNDNGIYDEGILDSIQPEEVYYLPKKLVLKKNWDIDQSWNIYETPVELQKPNEIKKNKPKTKRGERTDENNEEDDEDYYDPTDPFGTRGGGNRGGNRGGFGNFRSPGGLQQTGPQRL